MEVRLSGRLDLEHVDSYILYTWRKKKKKTHFQV